MRRKRIIPKKAGFVMWIQLSQSKNIYLRILSAINPSMSHAQDEHRNRVPLCHEREIGALGKIFLRKRRFEEHCKAFHPALPVTDYVNRCHFVVHSEFPKWCGFCERSHRF